MRILVTFIASLALLGALISIVAGMLGVFAGLTTLALPIPPEAMEGVPMSQRMMGAGLILVSLANVVNGVLYATFAIGTFRWKPWARFVGIFAYALNILVAIGGKFLLPADNSSNIPLIVGLFVAVTCMSVLVFAGKAYRPQALP